MRTTVTLDADTEAAVRSLMQRRGVSFKQALNDAIRAGGSTAPVTEFSTRVHHLGTPAVNLDKALQIAGEFDDEGLADELRDPR